MYYTLLWMGTWLLVLLTFGNIMFSTDTTVDRKVLGLLNSSKAEILLYL
jgi:hypothetical protein